MHAVMSSGCKSSIACVEAAHAPVRATYVNLYKWPESDAEFVKTVAGRARSDHAAGSSSSSRWTSSAPVVDSYSCRQMYLRSYTFSKKESLPEKTRRCLGKVKETAAVLPFLSKIRSGDCRASSFRSNASTVVDRTNAAGAAGATSRCGRKRKKTTTARKLREFSCSALMRSIFRRLLSCTASVDVVVDRGGHNYC